MARRKPPAAPPADIRDPRRRSSTSSSIRLYGFLSPLLPDDLREAWSIAWRVFELHDGPCPIPLTAFDRAVEAWPARTGHAALVTAWASDHGAVAGTRGRSEP